MTDEADDDTVNVDPQARGPNAAPARTLRSARSRARARLSRRAAARSMRTVVPLRTDRSGLDLKALAPA